LGHLLRRAFYDRSREKGYILPVSFKQKWISYQQKEARGWRYYPQYGNDLAQAYRLYTLALAGSPDLSSMNRMRETQGISTKANCDWRWRTAGQKSAGEMLLAKTNIDEDKRPNYYDYYYGSPERNRAMTLETLVILGKKQEAFRMAIQLAKKISSRMDEYTDHGLQFVCHVEICKSIGSKGIGCSMPRMENRRPFRRPKPSPTEP
jgi:hypothetical protein